MANKIIKSTNLLPEFLRSNKNSKFLTSTIDQLIQPPQLERIDGYIGSKLTPTYVSTSDVYIPESLQLRRDYQLDPALVINDAAEIPQDVIALDDLINEINTKGGKNDNLDSMFRSDFYSYDPHIDWDKLVNYTQYYWLPVGPETVLITGQQRNSTSTYVVRDNALNSAFIFNPNGLVEDPLLTLYNGNTYHFEVSSKHKFYIKSAPSAGADDLYNFGVTNNGTSSGIITLVVNQFTPNTLYYVAGDQQYAAGEFVIKNITQDSAIDVETEILGKKNYISGTGVKLTNGMKVNFGGDVSPVYYQNKEFFVEGVGQSIVLIDYALLVTPDRIASIFDENFDANPFDEYPFDNFKNLPLTPEYMTINRGSRDLNPWTRYNRWVHQDVISIAAKANGQQPVFPLNARAKRPIIEFKANLALYNFGTVAINNVDLIDTDTKDAFSIVQGSAGYYVDGVLLQQGHRVIFNADLDADVRGRVYQVNYATYNKKLTLELKIVSDTVPVAFSSTVINDGTTYAGTNWWYNGDTWQYSQQHTRLNQAPLFNLFDNQGIGYSDSKHYLTNFSGNKIFSYDVGAGANDAVLGFPLKYRNSAGVGSYLFKNHFMTDTISIAKNQSDTVISTAITYCKFSNAAGDVYKNVWTLTEEYQIPVLQFQVIETSTSSISITCIDSLNYDTLAAFEVYIDDQLTHRYYFNSRAGDNNVIDSVNFQYSGEDTTLPVGSRVLFKIYSPQTPNNSGYYETPISLTNNPLNGPIESMTLSDLSDHLHTMVNRVPDFTGQFLGSNNLRDLSNIEKYGSRLISNANPMPFAQMFIGKKEHSAVDAIVKAGDQYNQFKMVLLKQISLLSDQTDPVAALDLALKEINKDKDLQAPYYLSDMIAYGLDKTVRTWRVTNNRIKQYSLVSSFDPGILGMRSVLVYLNGVQLLLNHDYVFDTVDALVTILVDLHVGDQLVVNDYYSTVGCYVPPTPTKLGLYPKYQPSKFLDNTYAKEPVNVIQGHDGSLMVAYNDFRDDILIEFEKRIYNNIKTAYRSELLDINSILAGSFRYTDYSLTEITQVLQSDFIKWAGFYGIDYTTNNVDLDNPFTWNYSGAYCAALSQPVSGYWRAVYKYFYDTDRPHTHPWEMLGFSEQPSWWEIYYGPAPYTAGNTIMWKDIEAGLRNPQGENTRSVYARPGLSLILPVDDHGNLVSPDVLLGGSGANKTVNANITPYNQRQSWKFGDQAPAETAWRRSSYWPFAVQRLLALLKPAVYASLMYDTSRMTKNIAGQWTYGADRKFLNINTLIVSDDASVLSAGYGEYVREIGKQRSSNYVQELSQDLEYANLNLFYKVGGFVSKDKIQLIIDSVDPASASAGAILPPEDYKLILNVSNPIKSIGISGVIVQKVDGKFVVKGYDRTRPYFSVYTPIRNANTPTLTVGGVSEPYVTWNTASTGGNTGLSAADTTTANAAPIGHFYQKGQIVLYGTNFYRVTVSHQAEATFNTAYYQILTSVPTKGGATVQVANKFNTTVNEITYGTEFDTLQQVYDLLVGYGAWLTDQGFIFDEYNIDFNSTIDWNFSAKEFLYWSTQNWANNSVITLSPFSDRIKYSLPNSVVDNVFSSFYEYSILQANGTSLPQKNIDVDRNDGVCIISTNNATSGIYFAIIHSVQKEHAMVFNNTTMFNDTIYSMETGYRQQRMRMTGFRTANWNGDYFSPGFVYDTAPITTWQPYTDYQPSSIVRYKNGNYYSAIRKLPGSKTFDFTQWVLLGSKPIARLLPNFDYKINQFEDFYSLDIDNFDSAQQKMAQHLTGFTPRVYLTNVFTDPIAQYKFYQGFIKEKGTRNAVSKLAKASVHNLQGEMTYTEEWAFRIGQYGSYQTYQELEVPLIEGNFIENPQVVSFVDSVPDSPNDLIYYSTVSDRVIAPANYVASRSFALTTSTFLENDFQLTTAGYARVDDVAATAYNENSLLDIANNRSLNEGDVIWLGFKQNGDWDVLRYTKAKARIIEVIASLPGSEITVITDLHHGLTKGSIISIIEYNEQINGVYIVQSVIDLNQFVLASTIVSINDTTPPGPGLLFEFSSFRFGSYDTFPSDQDLIKLPLNTKIWVDDNGAGKWVVYQKVSNYLPVATTSSNLLSTQQLGRTISKPKGTDIFAVGAPAYVNNSDHGAVYIYQRVDNKTIGKLSYTLNYSSATELGYALVYDDIEFNNTGYGLIFAGAPAIGHSTFTQAGAVKISSVNPFLVAEQEQIFLLSPNPSNYERFGSSLYVQRDFIQPIPTTATTTATTIMGSVTTSTTTTATTTLKLKTLIVGATQYRIAGTDIISSGTGHVYAFTATTITTVTNAATTVIFGGTTSTTLDTSTISDVNVSYVKELSTSSITGSNIGSQWGYSISGSDNCKVVAVSAPGYPGGSTGTGMVVIFAGTSTDYHQTITSPYEPGARFGEKVLVSPDGNYLFISAPLARGTDQSYGKVAVYTSTNGIFIRDQSLEIVNPIPNVGMKFGKDMDISEDSRSLVISALGTNKSLHTTFNVNQSEHPTVSSSATTFDTNITQFYGSIDHSGSVYLYNRQDKRFVFAQELPPVQIIAGTDYGHSVSIDSDVVYVGAPAYDSTTTSSFYQFYKKDLTITGWDELRVQDDLVSIDNIQQVRVIDNFKEEILDYLDVIDPLKGRIAGTANQELKYKSAFDPAVYSIGIAGTVNDPDTNWLDEHVGELWWDLSSVKYQWYEQGDATFRKNNWGKLFPGAVIDVYEWVGTDLLPADWSAQADTSAGLTRGISGQPKFSDNSVISIKQVYNSVSNSFSNYYYYWVKNKITVPAAKNRRVSSFQIASLIANPTAYGLPYAAVVSKDSVILANIGTSLVDNRMHLNIASDIINNNIPKHTEWLLLKEGSPTSVPSTLLEKKLLDSLLGHDSLGNIVPDPTLTSRTRYGIGIRPQQTLFKDRFQALRNLIEFSNSVLKSNRITGNYNFSNLNKQDQIPDQYSHAYDVVVEDNEGLFAIDYYHLKTAKLACTVDNGKIRGVSIIDSGYGYAISPTVTIVNNDSGAIIATEIDAVGRVISASIVNAGGGFTTAPDLTVRPYTAIVLADSIYNGKWTQFIFDAFTSQWIRSRTQQYNTPAYWAYIDWASTDYNPYIDYTATVNDVYEINKLSLTLGQYVKVKNGGLGYYIILKKIDPTAKAHQGTFSTEYDIVYAENGTIQISDSIWDVSNTSFNFDQSNSYDQTLYDQTPDLELQYILAALKNDLFIRDLKVNWNLFFFKAVKYALTEQKLLDWAFKTSFISVTNNAGNLDQRPVYKLTDSAYFEQYLEEVKPYHSIIRDFTTNHGVVESTRIQTTDFDLPSIYNKITDQFISVDTSNTSTSLLNTYPWKSWTDNYKSSIVSISVGHGGSGYTIPPAVIIQAAAGDTGFGATAQAYIRSGQVIDVKVTNPGQGYLTAPSVTLIGGGDATLTPAVLYAQLSNQRVRSNTIGMKFDRISPINQIGDKIVTDKFFGDSTTAAFTLTWLAQPARSKIQVALNGSILLISDYTIKYYTVLHNGYYKKYSDVVFLNRIPTVGQVITVEYEKHIELQTAVERIQNYYTATSGMPGLDLPQLMTGIEYSKTTIETLPFDYTTAWDIEYTPFGMASWADDINYYTKAKIVTTAYTGTNTLVLDSINGIAVGQFANITSDIVSKFNNSMVTVTAINTVTSAVKFNSTITGLIAANTLTTQIEFWSYDSNTSILDSAIDGGTWTALASVGALGINPEDINLDGDGFYTPDTSYAPEELVPGQVTESLGINVYTKNSVGAPVVFASSFDVYASNTTTIQTLSIVPPNIYSTVVVFDDVMFEYVDYADPVNFTTSTQFTINWATNEIIIPPQSVSGKLGYTIVSIGGGVEANPGVIDVAYLTTDRSSVQLQSLAAYSIVQGAYVTVNGRSIPIATTSTDYGYVLGFVDSDNKRAQVTVQNLPDGTNTIQAWFFGTAHSYYNEITEQIFSITSPSQTTLTLQHPPGNLEPADAQVLVEIKNDQGRRRLIPPYISYYEITNITKLTFKINSRVDRPLGIYSMDQGNVRVYLNGIRLRPGFDYSINSDNTVTLLSRVAHLTDVVAIVDLGVLDYEYDIQGSVLTLTAPQVGSEIKVVTFTDHDGMLMQTERFNGTPTKRYKLNRAVLDDNYVWVQVNGVTLTSKLDFVMLDDQVTVQISDSYHHVPTDVVIITSISSQKLAVTILGYRIFTDMFNRTHFKRLSKQNTTYLTMPLAVIDTEIYVADASVLTPPLVSKKIPGVILVDGERIEFFKITGNVLSQLRRGTLGTSPAEYSDLYTKVIDQSPDQTIPYTENILRQMMVTTAGTDTYLISTDTTSTFNGDGITLATAMTADTPSEFLIPNALSVPKTIPAIDQVSVYYGGRLLRKSGAYYHDTTVAYDSPETNIIGTTSTSASLPDIAVPNDAYITMDTNKVWVYTDSNELNAVKGYVYNGLHYAPPEFTIDVVPEVAVPVATLINGGAGPYGNTTGFIILRTTSTQQIQVGWLAAVPGYSTPFTVTLADAGVYQGNPSIGIQFNNEVNFTLSFPIKFYQPVKQQLTLNIAGGVRDDIQLIIIKKQFDRNTEWNDAVTDNSTLSLMQSTTAPARFLQRRPAELPDKYYYGGDSTLTDSNGFALTDNNQPLQGY
jgi:hypothetical protein